jgi:hypothetical protein
MSTRREKVRSALSRALADASGPWVCGRSLGHANCGGWRYSARVHELRAEGAVILSKVCACARCRWANDQARRRGDQPANVHCYQLVTEREGAVA